VSFSRLQSVLFVYACAGVDREALGRKEVDVFAYVCFDFRELLKRRRIGARSRDVLESTIESTVARTRRPIVAALSRRSALDSISSLATLRSPATAETATAVTTNTFATAATSRSSWRTMASATEATRIKAR
jgi:hypothetical protein